MRRMKGSDWSVGGPMVGQMKGSDWSAGGPTVLCEK